MKIFIYDENRVLMRTVGTPDIMQGENNATLIFMSVAGIDETNFQNYLAQFAATIGTSHPTDIITDFGTYTLDGVEYKGWRYFVSSKFTQVSGTLNANLVLSSNGATLISQTVTLNINPSASGVTWFKNITQAQWEQLLAYCVGLRNPNLGELSDEDGLDPYCNANQAGAYQYLGDDGFSHLLFVSYDEVQDRVYQTDYYNNNGALLCRQRYTTDGDEDGWSNWVINSQASAISFNNASLPQLTGANTVQKAISALAHAVYPIAFADSLTPSPFTSVEVPNSKDKIIKDHLGQDLTAGGVLDYAFAIFGRNNTNAFSFDNAFIMTSDGAIYRMRYENGSMVAHWFDGSPAQAKAEQSAINQVLNEGIATNNSLIKHSVVGLCELSMDSDTYVITFVYKNLNGQVLGTYKIDIPAEMAFVGASYDNTTKDLTFTLQNGNEVIVPLDDIVSGLASEAWVNTAITNALAPYATASWVDSNYMSLTKGGMVDLAEDPASANTNYFGAAHGTKSFHKISDNSYAYRVSDGDGNLVQHNANKNGVVTWMKTANGVSTITKIPFKSTTGTHDLAFQEDLDAANARVTSLESKTAKNESDIQYLYRQVIGGGDLVTETDSGVALTSQSFPLTVSPKALLDYVGGMCQKVGDSIITAPVTKVVSKGFNLFNSEEATLGKVISAKGSELSISSCFHSDYIECKPNTTYYLKNVVNWDIASYVIFYDKDKNVVSACSTPGTNPISISITSPAAARYMIINGQTANIGDVCVNISNASMNGTYMPYRAPIEYPIPAEVQALEGYGYGLSAECNNHVSYEGKMYVMVMRRVDLGTLDFSTPSSGLFFTSGLENLIAKPRDNTATYMIKNLIISNGEYEITYLNNMPQGSGKYVGVSANGRVYFENHNYETAATFKTAMSGVYLYYEIAIPVETDISEYIDSDVIEVSAGGYLEFVNEDGMGVPYSTTYQYKPETQGGE